MTYESPITLIQAQTDNFVKEINEKTDEVIFKAVINVLPQVDKGELIRALAYDRGQYSKGYNDRESEIVRCKNCKYCWYDDNTDSLECRHCNGLIGAIYGNDFCSNAERREE